MIDDRLILLPVCRKHLITRQLFKLTLSFIELTVLTQPSSKLVAFSCGLRCKRHALIFMVEMFVVIGSCVAIAFIQVVLEAVHAGMFPFFFRPAAVLAGFCHFTLINTLNARCPIRTAGNFIGIILLTIGIGVRLHLAVCPDQIAVQIHIRIASVAVLVTVKTEQLRAGHFIPSCGCINVRIVDVDDELIGTHESVVDLQHLLTQLGGIHSAVVKVNPNVLCCSLRVNIDYFSLITICIKGAVIKYHGRGAIRPERIIIFWSIEGRISEHCTGIAPIGCLAVDDAVIHHSLIRTDEAQIICITGAKRHIFEGDCSGTIKAVIAVILCAEIGRVRHQSTDIPGRFVRPLTHKGQVFSLGHTLAGDLVQCIIALAKDDGITARCRSHSILQFRIAPILTVDLYRIRVSGAGCVIRKSQHGKHLKHHCHCQQGRQKPILTFLFQLSSFLSSLFAFLQRIPRKEPSRFLPHCHLPCRFHSPHCRSQPGC